MCKASQHQVCKRIKEAGGGMIPLSLYLNTAIGVQKNECQKIERGYGWKF